MAAMTLAIISTMITGTIAFSCRHTDEGSAVFATILFFIMSGLIVYQIGG